MTDHKPVIVGLDLGGSKVDLSMLYDGQLVGLRHFDTDFKNRGKALNDVTCSMEVDVAWQHVDHVFVEEPIVGRGVRASMQLSQMLGAVWCMLGVLSMAEKVELVPVTMWKKHVVGKAHATKEEVSSWLEREHPGYHSQCDGSQDLVDATCIGLYGARVASLSRSLSLSGGAGQLDEAGTRRYPAGEPADSGGQPAP